MSDAYETFTAYPRKRKKLSEGDSIASNTGHHMEDSIMKDADFMFLKKDKQAEIKTPKERDSIDLLELVCQLHSRSLMHQTKILHDAYVEVRQELELRITKLESEKEKEAVDLLEWMFNAGVIPGMDYNSKVMCWIYQGEEMTSEQLYKQFKQRK